MGKGRTEAFSDGVIFSSARPSRSNSAILWIWWALSTLEIIIFTPLALFALKDAGTVIKFIKPVKWRLFYYPTHNDQTFRYHPILALVRRGDRRAR